MLLLETADGAAFVVTGLLFLTTSSVISAPDLFTDGFVSRSPGLYIKLLSGLIVSFATSKSEVIKSALF